MPRKKTETEGTTIPTTHPEADSKLSLAPSKAVETEQGDPVLSALSFDGSEPLTVEVFRVSPVSYGGVQTAGFVDAFDYAVFDYEPTRLIEEIKRKHGGGRYRIQVRNIEGHYRRTRQIDIPGKPRLEDNGFSGNKSTSDISPTADINTLLLQEIRSLREAIAAPRTHDAVKIATELIRALKPDRDILNDIKIYKEIASLAKDNNGANELLQPLLKTFVEKMTEKIDIEEEPLATDAETETIRLLSKLLDIRKQTPRGVRELGLDYNHRSSSEANPLRSAIIDLIRENTNEEVAKQAEQLSDEQLAELVRQFGENREREEVKDASGENTDGG